MRSVALLLIAAATLPAQEVVGRRDRVFTLSERVGSGDDVRIFAQQGTITVTEASGSTLEFRAEKERGDAEDIGFVVRRSDGLTICAIYDSDDDCTEDGIRSEGRRWRRWNDRARANITVAVPRGMRLRISSGNGDVSVSSAAVEARVASGNGRVRVNGVRGQVTASSGNGRVTVEDVTGPVKATSGNGDVTIGTVAGPVSASSGNGDILVSMDRLSGEGDMEFTSGNGRIAVTLPSDLSADLEASTGSGQITTDFPIKLSGRLTRTRLRGTIGDGGRRLRMSTGNGSMELRRR
ncbi:MAG: DUF4097 family beta strand repeat protein [Gemmatimonadetes bacterium]|nr:DUF4097 family beta strand repeat protein [Gemmatimonadota bacterium]